MNPNRIAPRSGVAFRLEEGETLTVVDPQGGQVSDLLAFNANDVREVISNGRTFDYEETISLGQGFLLTPCSEATFRHFYADKPVHRGCFGNLAEALSPYGVEADMIPTAFNLFMNVPVDGATGRLAVEPPVSKSGDHISMRALSPLIIGLTACSAYDSCGGTFKPIDYAIDPPTAGVT